MVSFGCILFLATYMTFQRFGTITLISLYVLILAGGIVRSTGSGMGCPDWPKCFGQLVPPTHISELPFNYQEIYKEKLHGEVLFNPTKTWIEYLNRLMGALTGLFMATTLALSIKKGRSVFLPTLAAFLLVMANAVLGKYVVDSFLLPGVVTMHMLTCCNCSRRNADFGVVFEYAFTRCNIPQSDLVTSGDLCFDTNAPSCNFLTNSQGGLGNQNVVV